MTFSTTKLKWVATSTAGGTPSVAEPSFWSNDEETGLPWVSIGDMSGRELVTTTGRRITDAGVSAARLPVGTPGTLLLSMYASLGHTAFLTTRASWNQAILGIDVSPSYDVRFVKYALDAIKPTLTEFARSNTQANLNAEQVGNLVLPDPPLGIQRRIADFLDAETARIDRMIAATRAQHDLVRERESVAFTESAVRAGGPRLETLALGQHRDWPTMPLNRVLKQLTNGYVGPTRDLFVDEGVPYLQSLHIKHGKIDFSRRPYYVSPAWTAERPRIRLGFEDILIVQTGAIGEVGIVDESFVGASCHALLIARTDRSRLRPRFLWHALRSHWGRHALIREQTGALHPHLEAGNVRFMKFPIPSLRTQDRVVADTEAITRDVRTIQLALARRLSLQAERRQALITAAVTGQFDVSTASGRNVTEGVSA